MSPTIFCGLVFLLPAAVRGFTLDDGNKKTLGTPGIFLLNADLACALVLIR